MQALFFGRKNMLIKCPKCHVIYKIEDTLIGEKGLKMRCSECAEVFTAHIKDALPQEENLPNVSKMFARLEKQTAPLFTNSVPQAQSVRVVEVTKYRYTFNFLLILLLLFIMFMMLYVMRYDVVRLMPKAESLYKNLGIESIYYGQYLTLENIKMQEFAENNLSKIRITGMVVNGSPYAVDLPPVKVEISDKDGKVVLSTFHHLYMPRIEAGNNLLFDIVVKNPLPFEKNVHITFENRL